MSVCGGWGVFVRVLVCFERIWQMNMMLRFGLVARVLPVHNIHFCFVVYRVFVFGI